MILTADAIHTAERSYTNGWISIEDGVITALGDGDRPSGEVHQVQGEIVPAFVDAHIHGGGGASFGDDPAKVLDTHHRFGTTRMVASLVSAPISQLEEQINRLKPFVRSGALLGIHLEGPFLAEECRGAHDREALQAPAPDVVRRLLEVGDGAICSVTIAPELDYSMEAIRTFHGAGVLVCLGHTAASADQTREAVSAGASAVTHLFNGMPPMHHRVSGIVDEALINDRLTVELILDGHHVNDNVVHLALSAARDRWIAVTDAMSAAGYADGDYFLGDVPVRVVNGKATLIEGNSLAGSTLTMEAVFGRLLTTYQLSYQQAIAATSLRPGQLFGRKCGLGVGLPADLVVWQAGRAVAVMRDGSWLP